MTHLLKRIFTSTEFIFLSCVRMPARPPWIQRPKHSMDACCRRMPRKLSELGLSQLSMVEMQEQSLSKKLVGGSHVGRSIRWQVIISSRSHFLVGLSDFQAFGLVCPSLEYGPTLQVWTIAGRVSLSMPTASAQAPTK
jgi:hypothetical protein